MATVLDGTRWTDPFPGVHGVLLSDMIDAYVDAAGLIDPFDRKRLQPAGYGLGLGSLCYSQGSFYELGPGDSLVVPPNSIVYVTAQEALSLPAYLIARFDLRIDLVYQGLLLGTGPHVDPGFHGRLSCPLHNISNNEVTLRYGRPFANVEFAKTTPFGQGVKSRKQRNQSDETATPSEDSVPGIDQRPCLVFPQNRNRKLPDYMPAGRVILSSVDRVAHTALESVERAESIKKMVDRRLRLQVVGAIAIGLTLAALLVSLWQSLEARDARIDARIGRLEDRAREFSTPTSSTQSPSPALSEGDGAAAP